MVVAPEPLAVVAPALRVVESLPAEPAAPAAIEVSAFAHAEASATTPAPTEPPIGMTVHLVEFSQGRNLALFGCWSGHGGSS